MPTTTSTTNRDGSAFLSIRGAAVAQNSTTSSFASAATNSVTAVGPDESQDLVSEGNTKQKGVAESGLPNAVSSLDDDDSNSECMFFDASEEERGHSSDDDEKCGGGLDYIWRSYCKETLLYQKTTKAEALLLLVHVATA